ncbi:MAG: hypothetical protein OHK0039_38320 [Bacteroidia bacterium]
MLDRGQVVEHMVINLRDINFEFGSARLDEATRPYLVKVVELMQRVPNLDLAIGGHTDNVGDDAVNLRLSQARADTVARYLMLQGIDTTRLDAVGYGESQPIAPNAHDEGRRQNRRVVLELIKKESVQIIQDMILLHSGDTLWVVVLSVDDKVVRYRSFSSTQEKTLRKSDVAGIVYASGEHVVFEMVKVEPKPPVEQPQSSSFSLRDLWAGATWLDGLQTFGRGTGVVQGNLDLISNLGANHKLASASTILPSVSVLYEHGLTDHVSVGMLLAGLVWREPFGADAIPGTFTYWVATPRVAYHLNFHDRLDTYVGLGMGFRFTSLSWEFYDSSRSKVTLNPYLGARYYFTDRAAAAFEMGSDGVGIFKLGIAYRLIQ